MSKNSKKKKSKLIGIFRANEKGFGFVEFEDEEKDDGYGSYKGHYGRDMDDEEKSLY